MKPSSNNVYIIIPAFNEQKNIQSSLKKIRSITSKIIVVDDGSADKTYELAKHYAEHVLKHVVNLGKGSAMKTGAEFAFNKVGASAIIFIDADNQHNPNHLKKFLKLIKEGHTLILGVRDLEDGMPKIKVIMNKLASNIVLNLYGGSYIPDIPSGFKAMSKSVYELLKWKSTDYSVELEIAIRIAVNKVPFITTQIQTLYLDHNKGMTVFDSISMISKLVYWKFSL